MKKELILGIVLLLFLTGCSSNAEDETLSSSEEELNDLYEDYSDDSTNDADNQDESVEKETNTMKFCESTKQTDLFKYEYYWTEDEYYEKVITTNGGEVVKVATPDTVCVMLAGSLVEGWECSDGSESLFQETKGVVEDSINNPADIYGLVCEDIPYDGSIFEVN